MEAIMKHTHTIVIDQLLSSIKSIAGNTQTQDHNDATIKDFTGITGACKLELSIVGNSAILTRITGDVEGVIGWNESDLIAKDLLKLMGVDKELVNKSFKLLSKNGFAYKENKFYAKDGSEVNTKSILMWREHEKKIVEIIWK
jgi:hypothetical protein